MTRLVKKNIPKFQSEAEEREFWEHEDSSEFVNWSHAQQLTFSNLKPSTRSISLRLPEHLLEAIRMAANRCDVPYQSLMKLWLAEKVQEEADKRRL